jgi:hypothetical protein
MKQCMYVEVRPHACVKIQSVKMLTKPYWCCFWFRDKRLALSVEPILIGSA